jgi:hypothetical protein
VTGAARGLSAKRGKSREKVVPERIFYEDFTTPAPSFSKV